MDHKTVIELELVSGTTSRKQNSLLVIADRYTSFCAAYPCVNKTTEEVIKFLHRFLGSSRNLVQRVHNDNAGELVAAAETVGTPSTRRTSSISHDHPSNGVIESRIKTLSQIIRAAIHRSGLDHAWWPEAAKHAADASNLTSVDENGTTSFALRYPDKQPPVLIPFGCRIDVVLPHEVRKEVLSSFSPSAVPSIFLGYDEEEKDKVIFALVEDVKSKSTAAVIRRARQADIRFDTLNVVFPFYVPPFDGEAVRSTSSSVGPTDRPTLESVKKSFISNGDSKLLNTNFWITRTDSLRPEEISPT